MRKTVKNCRDLNMQTIRVRRGRPSPLAVSLALAITMLVVYLLTLQGVPKQDAEAAASVRSSTELHLEGMEAQFLLSSVHDDETHARVAAALCAQNGGAGLVLRKDDQFGAVYEAGQNFADTDGPVFHRSASGLTMRIDAPVQVISALADAVSVLRALATETGMLADSIDVGEMDVRTVATLLGVYRTQLDSALSALADRDSTAVALVCGALEANLRRVDSAIGRTDAGQLRLVHAGACLEWMELLNRLNGMAEG